MQHEITERIPLLDGSGNLTQPGYAKKLLPVYRRADIKAGKLRIKEWDYYLINNAALLSPLPWTTTDTWGLTPSPCWTLKTAGRSPTVP